MYLLPHYIMSNHFTEIKQNFTLLDPQKQYGKFFKYSFYIFLVQKK